MTYFNEIVSMIQKAKEHLKYILCKIRRFHKLLIPKILKKQLQRTRVCLKYIYNVVVFTLILTTFVPYLYSNIFVECK